jgi:hypothetical protein
MDIGYDPFRSRFQTDGNRFFGVQVRSDRTQPLSGYPCAKRIPIPLETQPLLNQAEIFLKFVSPNDDGAYNKTVANIPKAPREEFEAVIKLLRTPMHANAITDKRPRRAGAKRPGPKSRRG